MPYKLLREVILHLKKKSLCPLCQARYDNEHIFVLGSNMNPETNAAYGLFVAVCPRCDSESVMMVEAAASHHATDLDSLSIQSEHSAGPAVTVNEVLDMHNFLKSWKGDVSELFNKQRS